jgi:4-hydroxybenzoate polyprenyltransferase
MSAPDKQHRSDEAVDIPLVVDLDGTLVRTDLLWESFFDTAVLGVGFAFGTIRALVHGKAVLERYLAAASTLDYATLPYEDCILDLIREAKAQGRSVYLATACDERHAEAIVARVDLFDGYFGSDGHTNLSGSKKAEVLVATFGEKGFDYVGNEASDLPVCKRARKAYQVRISSSSKRHLTLLDGECAALHAGSASTRVWLETLRVHQYAKNLLVFVPMLTAHQFALEPLLSATLAFLAFCAAASAVYILNDLLDLEADRAHPGKRNRPFASGNLRISTGLLTIPGLLLAAFGFAAAVSLEFVAVLVGYLALTTGYSFYLKRKLLADAVTLAILYATRIVGGAVAVNVPVSEWLFAFSLLLFTSLALMKRYVELSTRPDHGLSDPSHRDYRIGDLDIVAALAAGTGMNAVTIFALYVSSPTVEALYRRPKVLWLVCPILLYWIGRALLMAHRRQMDDDPIVFALKDPVSAVAIASILLIVLVAI